MIAFVGAGPGAADLLTVRAVERLRAADVVVWASSLVPEEVLGHCGPDVEVHDSAGMTFEDVTAVYERHPDAAVVRLHSGDLSIWSAVAEQIRRLERRGIPYTLTPGVPAFAAAAATLGRELTLPEVAQSLVLTRVSGRASAMPPGETLSAFGATGATLAIHLAVHALPRVVAELTPLYGADCPVAIVGPDHRPGNCPDGTSPPGSCETPLCVAARIGCGCAGGLTMPSSATRIDRPGLSVATTFASVVIPRICATATPRPDRHLLSSYSSFSMLCGRSSGLRAIAATTRSDTCDGISFRTEVGGGGSWVAFLVKISMKLSPEYGGNPVTISYMIAPSA